jgi:hypothetical protein
MTKSAPPVPCPHCRKPTARSARYCRECGRELYPERFAAPGDEPDAPDDAGRFRLTPNAVIALAVLLLVLVVAGILILTSGDDAPQVRARSQPPVNEAPPPAPTPASDASPTGVIRAHFRAIADRDYDRAYDLLSAEYRGRVSRTNWVGTHKRDAPRVYIKRVKLVSSLPGGQAFVFADIYTRDTGSGGDSTACIHFAGKVRVAKRGDAWRYRPGAAGDTFDRNTVARSNRSCRRLFS